MLELKNQDGRHHPKIKYLANGHQQIFSNKRQKNCATSKIRVIEVQLTIKVIQLLPNRTNPYTIKKTLTFPF